MDNPNHKGNVAELAVALAASKLGIPVYLPITEHGRTDVVLEIASKALRVQCKWGRLSPDGRMVVVQLASSRFTPANGYVRRTYEASEIDFVAAYCAALDRCYLLPPRLFVAKSVVYFAT